MKVPVYRSQTLRGTPQRAAQLSVRASPGALSQDSRALAGFGDELARQATDLYGRVIEEERRTKLNEAEVQLNTQLASLKDTMLTTSPSVVTSKGPQGFRARADMIVQKLTEGIDDSAVIRRFKKQSLVTLANANISVNKNARARQIQASYDAEMALVRQYSDILSRSSSSATDLEIAKAYLYGEDGETSVFQRLANRGLIAPGKVAEAEKANNARIEKNQIREDILKAKLKGDNKALETLQNLTNTLLEGTEFPNVSPGESINLANQSMAAAITIQNEQESAETAATANAAKTAKAERDQNERDLTAAVINWQDTGDNKPSINSIAEQLKRGEIDTPVANAAYKALTTDKPIQENPAQVAQLYNRAQRAETELEIAQSRARASMLAGDGDIELSTFTSVVGILDAATNSKRSTAAATENAQLKKYSGFLNQFFSRDTEGITFPGYKSADEIAEQDRFFDASVTYYELATSPNFTPKQAYELVKQQAEEAADRELPFLGLDSALMDRYFPQLAGVEAKNLNFTITDTQIVQARIALKNDDKKEHIQKAEDFKTLDQLQILYDQSKIKKEEDVQGGPDG